MSEKIQVYIAAPFELQHIGKDLRELLESTGNFIVTSRWLEEEPFDPTGPSDDEARLMAERDLEDIGNSNAVIALNPEEFRRTGTGGRHVELGYVLGYNVLCKDLTGRFVPVWILGVRTNVFHYLPDVQRADTDPLVILNDIEAHFALPN